MEYFETIIRNIDKLKKNNISFAVRMTVTNNTILDLYENIRFFHEKGYDAIFIGIDFTANYSEKELDTLYHELEKIANYYIKEYDKDKKNCYRSN